MKVKARLQFQAPASKPLLLGICMFQNKDFLLLQALFDALVDQEH